MPSQLGGAASGAASGAMAGASLGPWGAAIGGVAGGVIGFLTAAKERGASDEELAALLRQYQQMDLPELHDIKAEQLDGTAYDKMDADPALRTAQYEALARMQRMGADGGNTLENQANLNQGQNEAYRQAMASRQAIQNNMAARGMSNSGASLAMQLGSVNAAQDRAGQESLQAAANAQRNAYSAIQSAGQLSSNMRTQQFSEEERKAQARDMMAKYNADSRSKAAYYNHNIPQQQFENQLSRATGLRGATGDNVAQQNANANRTQGMWTDLGAGAGQVLGAAAGSFGGGSGGSAGGAGGGDVSAPVPMDPSPLMDPNNPNSIAYKKKAGQ